MQARIWAPRRGHYANEILPSNEQLALLTRFAEAELEILMGKLS